MMKEERDVTESLGEFMREMRKKSTNKKRVNKDLHVQHRVM